MHGSESTAARSCKFIFRAGPRVAPLRGSTSPPAFEISFKIVEGECVGPIAQTRASKIGDRVPDFLRPRLGNRTYTCPRYYLKTRFLIKTFYPELLVGGVLYLIILFIYFLYIKKVNL